MGTLFISITSISGNIIPFNVGNIIGIFTPREKTEITKSIITTSDGCDFSSSETREQIIDRLKNAGVTFI